MKTVIKHNLWILFFLVIGLFCWLGPNHKVFNDTGACLVVLTLIALALRSLYWNFTGK